MLRHNEVFVKNGIAFTFPPSLLTQCWPNGKKLFPNHSTLIQGGGERGSIIVLRSRSQEIASSTYSFWLSRNILSKIVP